MSTETIATPEEGELVVATIKTVKQNGAYVDLDEYQGIEGFIFIGEIASGWVKNIRGFVREGQPGDLQKSCAPAVDGTSLELSLKSVSEERRRDRLQEWKNEQRAQQLLKVLGEKVGWSTTDLEEQSTELVDAFGTLYTAFEEAAMQEGALTNAGFEGDWLEGFIEIAVENIIPPFVEVRGILTLSINAVNGVSIIQEALKAAEALTNEGEEIDVKCYYDGAQITVWNFELRISRLPNHFGSNPPTPLQSMIQAGGEATVEVMKWLANVCNNA